MENGSVSADDPLARAEGKKNEANALFKDKKYSQAVQGYGDAIELNPNNAVYYSNRALAHIRMENYGAALEDSIKATEVDPSYIKAYYRRGDANFALGRFKDALINLKKAAQYAPNDPDLRKKLNECTKAYKKQKFEECLRTEEYDAPPVSETLDLSVIEVEESYKGPRMDVGEDGGLVMSECFMKAMIEEFKAQRIIHRRYALHILIQAQNIMKGLESLVELTVPAEGHLTVCGDIHGQFYDLLNIFELNGLPSPENPYLFNGDFVDRGSFSLEVILTLLGFKCLFPNHMHLTRGNHESKGMNKIYGFDGEVRHKYNETLAEVFRETFCWMPLAFTINKKVLVLHGGLFSEDGVKLEDIKAIDRNREPPDEGLMCEILWSDPSATAGRGRSQRGVGVAFGPDITKAFLDDNDLELLVRSHEVKDEGYEVTHDGRLVTVFSAPNYCDSMGNKGAFLRFNGSDMVPHFTTFSAVQHPDVKPMAYASSFLHGLM